MGRKGHGFHSDRGLHHQRVHRLGPRGNAVLLPHQIGLPGLLLQFRTPQGSSEDVGVTFARLLAAMRTSTQRHKSHRHR